MPLTAKGKKILRSMVKEYGREKGEAVFYASVNASKIKGAGERRRRRKRPGEEPT